MADDIYIDVPAMQNLASRLNTVYGKLGTVISNLDSAKAAISEVWVDDGYEQFNADYEKGIDNLLGMKVAIDSIEAMIHQVCEEYQAADNYVMSLL